MMRQTPKRISINGTWSIRPDPGNVGVAEEWFKPPEHPVPADAWRPADVPGAWQHALGDDFRYLAWYERRWHVPDDWQWRRMRIRFESVATQIDLWINGEHVGRHVGDYVPVDFDLTRFARPGAELMMTARVDEVLGHITKGFHDMISIHHGGIWGDVSVIGSGGVYARPNGVAVRAETRSGSVEVIVELAEGSAECGRIDVEILDPHEQVVATGSRAFESPEVARIELKVESPLRWSPAAPVLYTARVALHADDDPAQVDAHEIRFGFRTIETSGTRILLNESPIHIRGVLHWGHEPRHLAPAPSPNQVRAEFERLRAMGFNCVCLCMWYPPEHYFEIADEMGMLIWQEHPVWHSPMDQEYHNEYHRLFREFMRRDRNHPSVVIVSSTCEHPTFHPDLAQWWWKTAREELREKLLQVQTSSFAWSDPDQTDLYDEHTYDNNNRWVTYLQDLQEVLGEMAVSKPFVMGESILFTSWPEVERIRRVGGSQSARWSLPQYHESALDFERDVIERYGAEPLERFRRQADRHHLLGRKFQVEMFRRYPNHAGVVMNHLIDVPACTCGFMNALGEWRFEPEQTRGFLADAVLSLRTPEERRSFAAGERAACEILLSNFSPRLIEGQLSIRLNHEVIHTSEVETAACGEVASLSSFALSVPQLERPVRLMNSAEITSTDVRNSWDVWGFPEIDVDWSGVFRLSDLPFEPADSEPDRWERGYSRGFGIPAKSWINRLPDPNILAPNARPWRHDEPIPTDARLIITHRLTRSVIDFIEQGGSAILFATKAPGGLGTIYEWLFGQCPLVLEDTVLGEGDSEWVVDLLGFDLTRTYARVIPVEELGLVEQVQPIVRLVYTHDQKRVKFFDQMFITRVGAGALIVSSLDHHDPAGRYLLGRAVEYLLGLEEGSQIDAGIDGAVLRSAAVDAR